MSNINGKTCIKSEKYKNFYIDTNLNQEFQAPYYTVFNPYNQVHVHINRYKAAKSIVDCYYSKRKNKYGRLVRNRAMELEGFDVRF